MSKKYIALSLIVGLFLLVTHGVKAKPSPPGPLSQRLEGESRLPLPQGEGWGEGSYTSHHHKKSDPRLVVTAAPIEMQRNLLIVSTVKIAPSEPATGEVVSAEFTVQNVGDEPITFLRLLVGGRGPDCDDFSCPEFADYPFVENLTLEPNETYDYSQSRTFWAAGDYFAQIVYQSPSGTFHFVGERVDYTVAQGLALMETLTLTATDSRVNDLFYARFKVRNVGDRPITLPLIGVFGRGPECQEISFNCTATADFEFESTITLAPNETFAYEKWRQFRKAGDYAMQIAVSDEMGIVHFLFNPLTFTVLPADMTLRTDDWLFGAHFHPVFNPNDAMRLPYARRVGVRVVRIAVEWRVMEPTRAGQYDEAFYMPRLAEIFDYAKELDIGIYVMLSGTPCWASTDPNKNCTTQQYDRAYPPANPTRYANTMRELMRRHGDDILAYEVWNEPNIERFWRNPDPDDYVALLKKTYTTLKAQDPTATVLGGSLAATDVHFLDKMYDAGAQGYFDALAVHPYTASAPDDCSVDFFSFLCGVEAIRSMMLHNQDDKPIWFTEFGWSSYTGAGGFGEAAQLAYLQEAFEIIERWEFVPVATWYNLIDTNYDQDAPEFEHFFGLFRKNFRPKPVARWLQNRAYPNHVILPIVRR